MKIGKIKIGAKLLVSVAAFVAPFLAEAEIPYNLDRLTPLEQQVQPLVYDVFSVCYFGVDPVYTEIPNQAVRYWERIRSHPTHPLDFVITYMKATHPNEQIVDVHCIGWLTLIDDSAASWGTGTVYAEWDLTFASNVTWSVHPASNAAVKPVLVAFNDSSSIDFLKDYPGSQ